MSYDDVFDLPEDRRFADGLRDESEAEDRESWLVEPEPEGALTRHWGWLLVLGIAWLLFELSVDPAFSVVVASFGLGGNHFLSAWYLWRRDRDRPRARACAAFYLAAGFWRITGLTFALIAAAAIISLVLNIQHGKKDDIVTGIAMMIVLLCFFASGVTTSAAVLMGLRQKLKVWLDPQIRVSRRKREWPPRSPGPNRLGSVITGMVSLIAILELFIGYGCLGLLLRGKGPQNLAVGVLACVLAIAPIVVAAATVLIGREWAARKLRAASAHQCWPDGETARSQEKE